VHATSHAIAHSSGQTGQQAAAMSSALYPSLMEYMGMEITPGMVSQNGQLVAQVGHSISRYKSFGCQWSFSNFNQWPFVRHHLNSSIIRLPYTTSLRKFFV